MLAAVLAVCFESWVIWISQYDQGSVQFHMLVITLLRIPINLML